MYAIRSYYVPMAMYLWRRIFAIWRCRKSALALSYHLNCGVTYLKMNCRNGGGKVCCPQYHAQSDGLLVITSYSIHYTKLYDTKKRSDVKYVWNCFGGFKKFTNIDPKFLDSNGFLMIIFRIEAIT